MRALMITAGTLSSPPASLPAAAWSPSSGRRD